MKMIKWIYYVIYEYNYRRKQDKFEDIGFFRYLIKCLKLRKHFIDTNKDWFYFAQGCHRRLKGEFI